MALEKAFSQGGKEKYWRRQLEFETPKTSEEHWMRMAAIHARLNQPEKALDDLRQARQESPVNFVLGINTDPNLESLRQDPGFRILIDELWHSKHSVNAIPSPPNPPLPLRSAALTPSPPVEKRD